ncbi:MAG: DUF342 domain-containing protein [Chitinispirillaceae bacterium]|nr:DUF342 domain-containing protein [Chitinispirillaceae bacterium]
MTNGITVTRTPDGLYAYVTVLPQREINYPSGEEVLQALKQCGVVYGINTRAINDMVTMRQIGQKQEVARGMPPEPGIAGRIEMNVDIASVGKPKKLPDGRVDYHDISYIINVRKGDVLARRIPPVPGKEGLTVLGKPIAPPLPSDARLPKGAGTRIMPSDPDVLIAEIDGGVGVEPDGSIEVRKEKRIPGDIDYQTGDVRFAGDLTIQGTVRAGFSVDTKGSLLVHGSVEDASIRCGGNLVVKRGAVGSGSGTLESKGAVRVRHLENLRVIAGTDVVILEDAVNAMVACEGIVYAKSIRGGVVAGACGVMADEIGSESEARTVIDIGRKYELQKQRYDMLSRIATLATEMEKNRELVFEFVRDHLDENGALSYDNEKILGAMKLKGLELEQAADSTQAEIERIDSIKLQSDDPYVQAGIIYPSTVVKFGMGEQLVRERLEHVRLKPAEKGTTVALIREKI